MLFELRFFPRFIFLLMIGLLLMTGVAQSGWRKGMSLPVAIAHTSAEKIGREIFVLRNNWHAKADNFFEAYDVDGDGWRPLMPMPVDRSNFGVSAAMDRLFVTGGINPQSELMSDGVWSFSPAMSQWYQLPPMPGVRAYHKSIIVDDYLYVLGGRGVNRDKIYRYDLGTSEWKVLDVEMPVQRVEFALAAANGEIYLIGGRGRQNETFADVHVFNPKDGRWRRGPDLPAPVSGGSLVEVQGHLHLLGGYALAPEKTLATHYVLTPQAEDWRSMPAMPIPRHHAAALGVDEKIIVIGGALGVGFYAFFTASDDVSIYTP
ncbi:MAG: Kelch repeat-containing protein [Parvibaculales bacterium]